MKASQNHTFRAFTIKHGSLVNRITTAIKLSKPFLLAQPPDPLPLDYATNALWDTGATKSVVTQATAKALELVATGVANVIHAGGASQSNTYLVNFYLPNNVAIEGVLVSECPDIAGHFGAIIGMDIISQGDLTLTNASGQTWMSFRTPAIQHSDYVVDSNRAVFAGVSRNAPCPCGRNGKDGKPLKYKHCHGLDTSFLKMTV